MSVANPLWGAPRIHGELLKIGIDVGQTTVAKYMGRRRRCFRLVNDDVADLYNRVPVGTRVIVRPK
jgi:hypothetical protein